MTLADQHYIQDQSITTLPDQKPIEDLVRAVIAKDRTAQKEFYNTYAPVIYGIIRRYIVDEAAAREILNDSFYKILTKMDSYGFKGNILGWMRTLTINTLTDHIRRNKKHQQALNHDHKDLDVHVTNDIVGKLSYKELLGLIYQLPETQRAVFNLYVFEDLPHKEISKLLDLTEQNCRWHLSDARRRLKDKIKSIT